MALIYQATNKINGKSYIGVTNSTLDRRRRSHVYAAHMGRWNILFHKAIRKYGEAAFDWAILEEISGDDPYEVRNKAFEAEIRLIAESKPEYNMTRGGEGVVDPTGEIPRKRGLGRRGYKHRTETVEKLRIAGHAGKELFATFAHMGPQAIAREVICLDDDLKYPSASAAARAYGVPRSAVIEMCRGVRYRRTVGGKRFQYAERSTEEIEAEIMRLAARTRNKLTSAQVKTIREMLRRATPREIAPLFGVSHATIYDIDKGRCWKDKANVSA